MRPTATTGRVFPGASRIGVILAGLLVALLTGATQPQATTALTTKMTWVVDDDREQCGSAHFTSIAEAVAEDRVEGGHSIRVCPGLYEEQVSVTKAVAIRGDPETIEPVDCFASTRPTFDPTTQAIVAAPPDAPSGVPTVLFDLQANNVELQGLVLLGIGSANARAIESSSLHSGYEIHHNLLVGLTVGASFRSSGDSPSSFHHNCLRENGWGLVNQFQLLSNARVYHNSAFLIRDFAFEQTPACPEIPAPNTACSSPSIGMADVTFDHNTSIEVGAGYRLSWSTDTEVFKNTVMTSLRPMLVGMRLAGANHNLRIVGNEIQAPLTGIASGSDLPSNTNVLIQDNTITAGSGRLGTGAGIGMGARALLESQILDNTVTGLQGTGIGLLARNTGNLVRGNIVTDSGADGIFAAAGATDNTFELNQMHGNGRILTTGVDARDAAWPSNVWRGNACQTDSPVGMICGVP